MSITAHSHLIDYALPSLPKGRLRTVLMVFIGSWLLAASSKISIVLFPIPFTMQSYAVLVMAMAMGQRMATTTVALYLLQGAIGLPMFAKGAGLAYLFGPSGGYLIGFLFSASLVGYLADIGFGKSLTRSVFAMSVGTLVIFVSGLAWLSYLFDFNTALTTGFYPFMLPMLGKLLLGAITLPLIWKFTLR